MKYENFCSTFSFPNYNANQDARAVFTFLSQPENIYSMIIFSELGLPAISGVAHELENHFGNAPAFPLSVPKNRQITGRMVKYLLNLFGYAPVAKGLDERAKLRNFSQTKFFKTAAIYEKLGTAQYSIQLSITR